MSIPVGIAGIGTYFPKKIETAAELVPQIDIPEAVLQQKMGIVQRHVANDEETVTMMATEAAKTAITQAEISPEQINMVVSHGSEHKDHLVWNAAAKIQHTVGAVNASRRSIANSLDVCIPI